MNKVIITLVSIITLLLSQVALSSPPNSPDQLALNFRQSIPICAPYTATVTWTAPTQREDTSAITIGEIASYKLYTHVSGQADVVTTLATNSSPYTIYLKKGVAYSFSMKTVDTGGLESAATSLVVPAVVPRSGCRYRGFNS